MKVISVSPDRCVGCRICEQRCSYGRHEVNGGTLLTSLTSQP
ncbi:MAG: 4Fe-4S binding protein [Desulfocucumaceae bacterium]